jgi:hypothetical protein
VRGPGRSKALHFHIYPSHDRDLTYQGTAPSCLIRFQLYSPPSERYVAPFVGITSKHLASHPPKTKKLSHLFILCIETHLDCCLMSRKNYLPRRVIDFGPSDGSKDPVLVKAFELQEDLKPVAASNPKFRRNFSFCRLASQYGNELTECPIFE